MRGRNHSTIFLISPATSSKYPVALLINPIMLRKPCIISALNDAVNNNLGDR